MRKSKEEMNGFDFLKEIDDPDERERFRREFCLLDRDDSGHLLSRDIRGDGYNSQLNMAILGHTEEQQLVNLLGDEEADKAIRRKNIKKERKAETKQFMRLDEARSIYDGASFLTQEHNLFFNAFITIAYKALCINEAQGMPKLLTSFLDEAGGQMDRWGYKWHYIYVHEHSQERGLHTHILAHVPPELKKPFTNWCRDSHASFFWRHCRVTSKEAIDIQIKHPRTTASATGWQWDRIQYVTKGLDPDLIERDPMSGQMKSVFDLIGQRPHYRRPGGVIPFKNRVGGSRLIWHTAQAKAKREGMPMLSALGEKAWTHLKLDSNWLGWEIQEYEVRTRRRDEYRTLKGPACPDEEADWFDQHRGQYSDSELQQLEVRVLLLRKMRKQKEEAWFADDIRRWRRDWMTWWDQERYCRGVAKPLTLEELIKTLAV